MSMHPARQLWATLEPLHALVYFAPEVRDAGKALGLRGYWMTYFAFRAAPLGAVGAPVVTATFANFNHRTVERAIPDAWVRTTPAACLETRRDVAAGTLRRLGVDEDACAGAVEMLTAAVVAADHTGRPLGAANAAVAPVDDPVGELWQLATTLREHRGDGHVASLVAHGIRGVEALALQAAVGRFDAGEAEAVRGWAPEQWSVAVATLRERGLLAADDLALTPDGEILLDAIEETTDRLAWDGALAAIGADGVAGLVQLLAPATEAVWRSGLVPDKNPIGVRPQG